jgi:hypothetical protein
VYDVAGRRVSEEDLGGRDAGTHRVSLATPTLPPGVYWVRLSHAGAQVSARALVLASGR